MRRAIAPGAALALVLASCGAAAQDPPPPVMLEQHGGTYVEPPPVDPLYLPAGPDQPATEPERLTLRLSFDAPLRHGAAASLGRGVQGSTAASPSLQAALRWTPLPDRAWFAEVILYKYLRPEWQQPWHPDFSYSFGYRDARPGTWSLFYANYTGTRFDPDGARGEHRFNFPEGQWTLARRFGLPAAWEPWLLVGDGDSAVCSGGFHLVPRYEDVASGGERSFKKSLSLGCRYTRPSGWFAELAVFAYPQAGQEQPWDPDYTYALGRGSGPGTLSIGYGNYSGNRFPGRARGAGEGAFRSGSLSLSWNIAW